MLSSFAVSVKPAGALVLLPALIGGCSGGGAPTTPSPPPLPTFTVNAVVFYDENSNFAPDGNELVRIPGVRVTGGGGSGISGAGGRVAVERVLGGAHTLTVDVATLPPGFVPGPPIPVTVPTTVVPAVPVTLPIGDNRPNRYMGFGDSITVGDGSSDDRGYREKLVDRLRAHWGGDPEVPDRGIGGTRTTAGLNRIQFSLDRERPAYTLIHYGTNDWNDSACRTPDPPCFTIGNLRGMVQTVKNNQSIPVLATVIPVNVGFDARVPPSRQEWVAAIDVQIRQLASEQGAILADMERAFLADPDLSSLFFDHVHPNDKGYTVMADVWFKAITSSRSGPASSAVSSGFALLASPSGASRGR